MKLSRALLLLAPAFLFGGQATVGAPFETAGHIQFAAIDEQSGIVKSKRYPNTYWVHNDSGDTARIFAIHADGSVIKPAGDYDGLQIESATNHDWEEITSDGKNLYISDMGNNGNARKNLGVYVLPEPDPSRVTNTKPSRFIPISYPDQTEFPPTKDYVFDCEAIFHLRGKLWFLTKHRLGRFLPGRGTNLYILDKATLRKVDGKTDVGGWVTGASVSPNGKTLAVLTHLPEASVWLFDISKQKEDLLSGPAKRLVLGANASQCEGICFDGVNDQLLVTNEQGDILRVRTSQFTVATPK